MNGESLVGNFPDLVKPHWYGTPDFDMPIESSTPTALLDEALRDLYAENQIAMMCNQENGPLIIDKIIARRSEQRAFRNGPIYDYMTDMISHYLRNNDLMSDSQITEVLRKEDHIPSIHDRTGDLEGEHVMPEVLEGIADLRTREMYVSFELLAQTVSLLGSQRRKNAYPLNPSLAVTESIKTLRKFSASKLKKEVFAFSVHRQYIDSPQDHAAVQVGTSVTMDIGRYQAPYWVTGIQQWIKPLHVVAAALSELDALVALQEWVVDRRLPYLPIISPMSVKDGRQIDGSIGKNLHADILLCNMAANEVIPVQVTNGTLAFKRPDYHPGMRFVTPSLLGAVTDSPIPVRAGQRVQTGRETVTEHGKIFSAWQANVSSPSKRTRETLNQSLEGVFDNFDAVILD